MYRKQKRPWVYEEQSEKKTDVRESFVGDVYRTDLDGRQYAVCVCFTGGKRQHTVAKVKMRSSNSAMRGRDYAQVMIALPCNLVSSRMNFTASLTSSWVFRCVSIKVVSVAEAFRSMRTTVL